MAILTLEQRHDLGNALLFCPSKTYSALYVHPDFRTNFNMSTEVFCKCAYKHICKNLEKSKVKMRF